MRVSHSRISALLAASVGLVVAAPAGAQQVQPPSGPMADVRAAGSGGRESGVHVTRSPTDYYGVTPGRAEARIPGARRARRLATRGTVVVEWPGFQMTGQGSRVFVAMSGAPTAVEPGTANQRLTYVVRNARLPLSNNRRTLETGAFETPVQRAYARQRGRDVELTVELRGDGQPTMTQGAGEGGLHYVFLDFPRWSGQVTTEFRVPTRTAAAVRPSEDSVRSREQIRIAPVGGDGTPDADEAMARAALRQGTRAGSGNTLDEPQRPTPPPAGGTSAGGAPVLDSEAPPPVHP